jgi:hypothetical protein
MATRLNDMGSGVVATCACSDREALIAFGDKQFTGQFNGSISARVEPPRKNSQGRSIVPLTVVGYTTRSEIEGLGTTILDVDYAKPLPRSSIEARSKSKLFPATQTMKLRVTMRVEEYPRALFRATTLGTLVNKKAEAFPPPPGSTYTLGQAVKLTDQRRGKQGNAQLLRVNTEIQSTELEPDRLEVGRGLALLRPGAERWVVTGADEPPEIRFALHDAAKVVVHLRDGSGRSVDKRRLGKLDPGEHSVPLDGDAQRRSLDYQLELDGEIRTARMPLIRPG